MKFFHCPLIHLITSTVYLSMIAFSMYSLLTGNKVSEAQANPNQILKKTVDKSLESPAMDSILMKYFKGQNDNYCSLIGSKVSEVRTNPNPKLEETVSEARANPDQKLKETVDISFESPDMDSIPNILTALKVSESRANPNPKLKETVDDTSFASPAMDTIPMKYFKWQNNYYSILIGNKVSETRANPDQKPKEIVNASFESPAMDTIPMKYCSTKYCKSYFNLQAKKSYFAPKCYINEKRLLLNESTNPAFQKGIDWTKKLLEKWY